MKHLLSIAGTILLAATWVAAQESVAAPAEKVAVLKDKRIHESSGLARSLRHAGVFWTHNDSSSEPCLFAVDETGQTRAKVRITEAVNFDWEDLASAQDEKGRGFLYIGDVGDNLQMRPTITIYEVPEPDLPQNADKELLRTASRHWHARYPDGRHNAETLLVHPKTRRMYVLTKSDQGHSAFYAFPEQMDGGQTVTLEKVGEVEFPPFPRLGKRPHDACMTTAGDFSPDASRVVVATYSFLHEWQIQPGETLAEALKKPSERIVPPLLMQLEAVCYGADSQTLWLTSERLPAPLWRISR